MVNGAIGETGGARTLATNGAITLGADNSYSGLTTISSGTLTITGAASDAGSGGIAVGANQLVLNNGATVGSAITLGQRLGQQQRGQRHHRRGRLAAAGRQRHVVQHRHPAWSSMASSAKPAVPAR